MCLGFRLSDEMTIAHLNTGEEGHDGIYDFLFDRDTGTLTRLLSQISANCIREAREDGGLPFWVKDTILPSPHPSEWSF